MAEISSRPDVREVGIVVKTDEGEERRKGNNLDDVLRAIIWDIREKTGWRSTTETARRMGLPQSTLALLMDESLPGTSLDTLSRVCAALKLSPVELFRLHELYKGEREFADDFVFNRFRSVLSRGEASRLLPLLEIAKDQGALDLVLTAAEKLATQRPAKRKRHATTTT